MNENPSSVLPHRGRNARTGIIRPVLPRLIALLLGFMLALGIGLQPVESHADLLGNLKRSIGNATSKARETVRRKVDKTRETVRRKVDSARERSRETVNRARERVERQAREQAERTRRAMREKARQAREQTERAQRAVREQARQPQVRERAMAAAITVAALGTYAALHGDDVVQAAGYRTLSYGLEHIEIQVDGRSRSLEELYTEAVLARAPFLAGTTMAEDPAALLVFGGEVVKDDLVNRVAIVPDGNGGARTIADTVGYSDDTDDVISALQLSSSIEGMAVSAAEQGHLGRHGEAFATVYGNTDRTVQQYRAFGE